MSLCHSRFSLKSMRKGVAVAEAGRTYTSSLRGSSIRSQPPRTTAEHLKFSSHYMLLSTYADRRA